MNIFQLQTNVKMQSSVRVNLSAHEWDLNTQEYSRHTIESVASYLNRRFNEGYNRGFNREKLENYVSDLMRQFEIYGANSIMSRQKLSNLLNTVYP